MSNAATAQATSENSFPIVGIGASAGGIEACSHLLSELSDNSGMAFVIIQHLSPNSPSMLSQILARVTNMPVAEATNDVLVEPNHVYVIPPNVQITIAEERLRLAERDATQRRFLPIDIFFKSLAENYKNRAVGVVLSGLDGDGAEGLKLIKQTGGITFAQTSDTAQHSEMPNTAIETGYVDFIASPTEIARELEEIAQHPYLKRPVNQSPESSDSAPPRESNLSAVYNLLRASTGIDFG